MIKMIWAMDMHRCIGKDNKLPWHLPEDLMHFKKLTEYETVVMGKRTFKSLNNKPLPNRRNVVLTSQPINIKGIETVNEVEEVLVKYPDCWIIGGAHVYESFMPYASRLYITKVSVSTLDGDTFAPRIQGFKFSYVSGIMKSVNQTEYRFLEMERIDT